MVQLNHTSLNKIKLHSVHTFPEECCGFLLGEDLGNRKIVCDVLQMQNTINDDRQRRYLITAEKYKKAEDAARRESTSLVGMYHSHPDHPAEPSRFDLEHAMPWWSYVIISLHQGQPAELKSWVLRDDRSMFDEEDVQILDGELVHSGE